MPKRHHRKMKGGFLESLGSTLSSWGSSVSQGANSLWDKTKKATSSATSSLTASAPTSTAPTSTAPTSTAPTSTAPTSSYTPSSTTPKAFGGRKRSKKIRGGFSPNSATTGLASSAGPFSGQTAQPKNWVGGRTRKHKKHGKKHRHTKRCRH